MWICFDEAENISPMKNNSPMKAPDTRHTSRARTTQLIELLETRIAPATLTWTGSAVDNLWTNPANWNGGLTPADGDTLIFDDTAVTAGTLVNDTTAGNSYSLIFDADTLSYVIGGNSILLDNAGTDISQQGVRPATVNVNLSLAESELFVAPDTELLISGVMSGGGTTPLTLNGTAGSNGGTLTLSGVNVFTGTAQINHRTVLKLGTNNALLPSGLTLNLNTNATLDMNGFDQELFVSGGIGLSGSGTVDNSNPATATMTLRNSNTFMTVRFNDTAGDLNLVKAGTGTLHLGGESTRSGTTTVNGGVLQIAGNGSFLGTGDVTVNGGATLQSTKRINGPVTVNANGTLQVFGNALGSHGTGDLTLVLSADFAVQVNSNAPGTGYDQVRVTGAVSLAGANLVPTGTVTSNPGQQIVLIENDGTDAVSGTFAGLGEGTPVTINGTTFTITYMGGSGNDVVLIEPGTPAPETAVDLVAGDLIITDINGGTTADTIILKRGLGDTVRVFDPGNQLVAGPGLTQVDANTVEAPFSSITGLVRFDALGGDDTFIVEWELGSPVPAGGIVFNGGAPAIAPGDRLFVEQAGFAGTFTNVAHTFTTHESGSMNIDGALISYTGVEETLNTLIALERSFTYPAGNEAIILADDAGVGLRLDGNFGGNPHLARFAAPGSQLTLNAGAGVDSITVSSLNPAFGASLTINGDAGDDLVQFTGPLTFAPGANLDVNLSDDAGAGDVDAITVGPGASLSLGGAGAATLTASKAVIFRAGTSLVTAAGNIIIEANQQPAPTAGIFSGIEIEGSLSTVAGNITLLGKGGDDAAVDSQFGIVVTGQITGGGAGTTTTLVGTGGGQTGGNNHIGTYVAGGTVTSTGGSVSITGSGGGNAASISNVGVLVESGIISASGPGNVTVTGTGGGSGSFGIQLTLTSGSIATTGTGNITLVADSLEIEAATTVNAGTNSVTFRPATNIVGVEIGSSDNPFNGPLSLSDAELDRVTAGTLLFGNTATGAGGITVSGAITRTAATNFITNSATVLGAPIDAAGGDLTFRALTSALDLDITGITLTVGGGTYTGLLSGTGNLAVNGTDYFTLANPANTFVDADGISLTGRLSIDADSALGAASNAVVFDATTGRLRTTDTFTTPRTFTVNSASGTVEVDGTTTLTLTGTVNGPGTLLKAGTGKLIRGAVSIVGKMLDGDASFSAGGTSIRGIGGGNIVVNVMDDGITQTIDSVEIVSTPGGPVSLNIKGPKIGTTTVNRIVSLDPDSQIDTIRIASDVKLGDGINDSIPDLEIRGAVTKLSMGDVNEYGIFELGKGLDYLDTYNNKPAIRIRDILGTGGLTIDVTGTDPFTPSGGGGLGKVFVRSWGGPGMIKTTQSIESFRLRGLPGAPTGLFEVSFEVDRYDVGIHSVASIGNMSVNGSSWAGQHVIVNGNVGNINITSGDLDVHFDVQSNIKSIKVNGTFKASVLAGSIGKITANKFDGTKAGGAPESNYDYRLTPIGGNLVANGGTTSLIELSPGVPDLNGDDYGHDDHRNIIARAGSIGLIKVTNKKLPANYGGIINYDIFARTSSGGISMTAGPSYGGGAGIDGVILQALTIKEIKSNREIANSDFVAYDLSNGDTNLGIGKITITSGGASDTRFIAGASMGADGLLDSSLPGDVTHQDTYYRDARIGTVTIDGALTDTVFSVGIAPGTDYAWGVGTATDADTAAAGALTPLPSGKTYIDAIKLTSQAGSSVVNYFQAPSFKSVKVNNVTISSLPHTSPHTLFRVI